MSLWLIAPNYSNKNYAIIFWRGSLQFPQNVQFFCNTFTKCQTILYLLHLYTTLPKQNKELQTTRTKLYTRLNFKKIYIFFSMSGSSRVKTPQINKRWNIICHASYLAAECFQSSPNKDSFRMCCRVACLCVCVGGRRKGEIIFRGQLKEDGAAAVWSTSPQVASCPPPHQQTWPTGPWENPLTDIKRRPFWEKPPRKVCSLPLRSPEVNFHVITGLV